MAYSLDDFKKKMIIYLKMINSFTNAIPYNTVNFVSKQL